MSLCKEAMGNHVHKPAVRKWAKTQLNRYHRRLAKIDPENAPKKKGYQSYS